jgi:hypothetical protein
MHAYMHKYVLTNITQVHTLHYKHARTHTTAGKSPQQRDTTNRRAAINSLKWQGFILVSSASRLALWPSRPTECRGSFPGDWAAGARN